MEGKRALLVSSTAWATKAAGIKDQIWLARDIFKCIKNAAVYYEEQYKLG